MTNIEPWVIARHLAHSSPLRLVRLVAWSAMLVLTLAAAVPQAQVLEKSPSPATNLEPFLVADINTSTQSADPGYLTTADGTLFFFAKDRTHGLELWKSDGTAAGTTLIEDLTPGIKGTWLPERPTVMTSVNDLVFFVAYHETYGWELWVSDGTAAGTGVVKDIYPGTSGAFDPMQPISMANVNGTLYFGADDGVHGRELWVSDGTAAGTRMLQEINPGAASSSPYSWAGMNGSAFFSAYEEGYGYELWVSDGTAAGTKRVKDIYPGQSWGQPEHLTPVNGVLFFAAADGVHGKELWKSDGTTKGTVLVKNIEFSEWGSSPQELTAVNDALFFSAINVSQGRELWVSDGTAGGTARVKDIYPGFDGSDPHSLTAVDGMLLFSALDDAHGQELWVSDGTEAGTVLVKDIGLGEGGKESSGPSHLTLVNGTLFFQAWPDDDCALWKSNGTAAGTVKVKDVCPGLSDEWYTAESSAMVHLGGTLFFRAHDPAHGHELWASDGTAAGTVMVKDIQTKTDDGVPFVKTVVNGTLLFRASDALFSNELWKTDGTTAGTRLVKDIHPSGSSYLEELTPLSGVALFQADDGTHGKELWVSDGTTTGTFLVKDIYPGKEDSSPSRLVNAMDTIWFYADDGVHGVELWKSDGTTAGTAQIKDIHPGGEDSIPEWPDQGVEVNDALFFAADDGVHGTELWVSDGTIAGTVMVKDVYLGAEGSMSMLRWDPAVVDLMGMPLFTANDDVHGVELWVSDGTASGTQMVLDVNPLHNCGFSQADPCGSHPHFLGLVDGMILFAADDGTHGHELWASDGTAVGTALVKDINPGLDNSSPGPVLVIGDTLFFSAGDDVHGIELWKSDGTEAGTVLVKDIHPGSSTSLVYHQTEVDGVLYFSAWDGVHGQELWTSDGTEAGTHMVVDLNVLDGAYPRDLVDWNGRLFFTADDGFVGMELWTLWEPRRIHLPVLLKP